MDTVGGDQGKREKGRMKRKEEEETVTDSEGFFLREEEEAHVSKRGSTGPHLLNSVNDSEEGGVQQ